MIPQRPDWVTSTEGTDTDFASFGCAAAFIWWLVTQLGHPLAAVIQQGGATLADTFRNLTGRGTGWVEFTDILREFYPVPVGHRDVHGAQHRPGRQRGARAGQRGEGQQQRDEGEHRPDGGAAPGEPLQH